MGQLTQAQIIAAGLAKAGNTSLTSDAATDLQAWLDSAYTSAKWRFLNRRYGPFSLNTGTTSFEFGDGTLTSDPIIQLVRLEIAELNNNGYKGEVDIQDDMLVDPFNDPLITDTTVPGKPTVAMVGRAISAGYTGIRRHLVQFNIITDQPYQVVITANPLPPPLISTSVPLYPADDTLIAQVVAFALFHQADEREPEAAAKVAALLSRDKLAYSAPHGQTRVKLSRRSFPSRRPYDPWRR